MAVAIIGGTLLRIKEHAVGFRGFAEPGFGSVLLLRISIGMPLQCSLAVGGLDLVLRSGAAHSEYFVIVTFRLAAHA